MVFNGFNEWAEVGDGVLWGTKGIWRTGLDERSRVGGIPARLKYVECVMV